MIPLVTILHEKGNDNQQYLLGPKQLVRRRRAKLGEGLRSIGFYLKTELKEQTQQEECSCFLLLIGEKGPEVYKTQTFTRFNLTDLILKKAIDICCAV